MQEQRPGRTNTTPMPTLAGDDDAESEEENVLSPASTSVEELFEAQSSMSTNASSGPPSLKKSKTPANSALGSAAVMREYLHYKKERDSKKSVDHLTKYFAGIEEVVRTFPTYLQIKVKSQISTLVHEAEYEAESAKQQQCITQQQYIPQQQPSQHLYSQNSQNFQYLHSTQHSMQTRDVSPCIVSNIEQQSSSNMTHL